MGIRHPRLYLRRRYLSLAILILPILGILAAAYIDGDLMRSTVFLFPVIFVAMHILAQHESPAKLANYALSAFGLSLLTGNYNVFLGRITWFMPLPIQWLDKGVDALVNWLKAIRHYKE